MHAEQSTMKRNNSLGNKGTLQQMHMGMKLAHLRAHERSIHASHAADELRAESERGYCVFFGGRQEEVAQLQRCLRRLRAACAQAAAAAAAALATQEAQHAAAGAEEDAVCSLVDLLIARLEVLPQTLLCPPHPLAPLS